MRSLYLDDLVRFEKLAGTPIGNQPAVWSGEITKAISNEHPYLADRIKGIKFDKMDESKGSAFGVAIISDGKEQIMVPLIINNNELEPLDVFIYNKEVFALSPVWVSKIFSDNNEFAKTIKKGQNKTPITYSNSLSKTASTPVPVDERMLEQPSVLDLVANMIRDKEKGEFASELMKTPSVIAAFTNNGNRDILQKVDEIRPTSFTDRVRALASVLPKDMIVIRKSNIPGEYVVDMFFRRSKLRKSMNREQFAEWLKDEDVKLSPDKVIQDVDKNGFIILDSSNSDDHDYIVATPTEVTSKDLDRQGSFVAKDLQGRNLPGFLFPVILDFDLNKTSDKLFVSKTLHGYQEKISGQASDGDYPITFSTPERGDYGTLVYGDKNVKVATVPFTIENIYVTGNMTTILVISADNKIGQQTLVVTPNISTIIKIDKTNDPDIDKYISKNTYFIPEGMEFMRLGPRVKFARTPSEFTKIASDLKEVSMCSSDDTFRIAPLRLRMMDGKFNASGDAVRDIPYEIRSDVDSSGILSLLASMGINPGAARKIIALVQDHKEISVNNIKQFESLEKTAADLLADPLLIGLSMDFKSINLIKEASVIPDKTVAESLLSLYFVTPENYYFFVEAIPQLELASKKLAKLLLSSRMGLNTIPQEAIKKALDSLDFMINKLNETKLKLYAAAL